MYFFCDSKKFIGEIVERIKNLCVIVPDWIKILNGSQGECVKIDKTKNMSSVLSIIKAHSQQ